MLDITIIVAFIAGLVSFLSPCVLPIIPGFLAYLAGGLTDKSKRWYIFLHSMLFVLGFAIVFSLLGVLLNSVLTHVATDVQIWLSRLGGVVIIFFGLMLMGLVDIPALDRPHVIKVKRGDGAWRYVSSVLFGMAFAVGWTPCVGAALGAILGVAASEPGRAFGLLMGYSLGLGIPFGLVGAFALPLNKYLVRANHIAKYVNIVFGLLLVVLGLLIFTQELNRFANFELLVDYLQTLY